MRDLLGPANPADSNLKDLVIDQMLRALKLFRRCKMIESELEVQFKLMEYLLEVYLSSEKRQVDQCMRLLEQMRVVHDQVIPLLDDSFCEGVVLTELAQICQKAKVLPRKETLYKFLAMKKFTEAGSTPEAAKVFLSLTKLTKAGLTRLKDEFTVRRNDATTHVATKESNETELVQDFLRKTFKHRDRQLDQYPFTENHTLVTVPAPIVKLTKLHFAIFDHFASYLRSDKKANSALKAKLFVFMLEGFQSMLSRDK